MLKQSLFIFILVVISNNRIFSQEYLEIDTGHLCIYHGSNMPQELYRFESSDSIEQLKDEILQKTGKQQNFEFICSNVPSVAAVVDKGKRYILYSRKYFNTQSDLSLRLAVLAHEIAHHVQEHQLAGGKPSEEEEMEADYFMGYALCLTGVPGVLVEDIAVILPLTSGIDTAERRQDIVRGFQHAEASLRNAEHAGWLEENPNEVIRNFPHFPFPPPEYSADADLDDYFSNCANMYQVDQKIRKALVAVGYTAQRYFYVPGGFALVTRLEQFNKDGSCKGDAYRWSGKIVRCETFSTLCYLKSIVTTEPAYFRTFVFVVTPEILMKTPPPITRKEAEGWLNEGANRLPPEIGNLQFKAGKTHVTTLIYEFKVRESDRKPVFNSPSELEGIKHLKKSKIINHLRN